MQYRDGSSSESIVRRDEFRALGGRRPCLILWDVDHTLISSEGMSKAIYAAAFYKLTGRKPSHAARTEGRTDPLIMEQMLREHGAEPKDGHIALLEKCLAEAGEEKAAELRARGRALPGAAESLTAVGSSPGITQSVLTGNIQANAIMKLAAFGLDRYVDFEIGGYGSDGAIRSDLVGVARRRAEAKYGIPASDWAVVLVGDTPRDVEAAHGGKARILAVASGEDSASDLEAAGADAVIPSLEDTAAVVRILQDLGR